MRISVFFVVLCAIFPALSYGDDSSIKTEAGEYIQMDETYTLILYGARHGNDIETVAIFDIDGDEYTIVPYAPPFDFTIERPVDSSKVMKRAMEFISWHPLHRGSSLNNIILSGRVIGYELRPLYDPLSYGLMDVLDIDYRLKGKDVVVRIRLIPQIERVLHDGDKIRGREDN